MNILKKLFKTKKSKMNYEKFQSIIFGLNETEKVLFFNTYLKKMDTEKEINKMLDYCSYESMTSVIFSTMIIKYNAHNIMFKKSKSSNGKWLMYQTLWNLFRYNENREIIKKKFVINILNDFDNLLEINEKKVYNVYFGCLSNICLNEKFKKLIYEFTLTIQNNIISQFKNKELLLTSISGLFANICVEDSYINGSIKSNLFLELIKEAKRKFETIEIENENTYVRNTIAYINNCMNNSKFLQLFCKIGLSESIANLENHSNFDHTVGDLIENLHNNFGITSFQDTTSLHLANLFKFTHIISDMIKKDNLDINIQDYLGNTILHYALSAERFDFAKFYILCGADVNIKNKDNETPISYNKQFVIQCLNIKNKIHKTYLNKIQKEFKKNISGNVFYENGLCNIVNSYIDLKDDIELFE